MNYNRKEVQKTHTIYYLNDKLHRTDGPAIEYTNGYKEWWIHDEEYSEQESHEYIKKAKHKCPEYMKIK